jgi:hypothetical protein
MNQIGRHRRQAVVLIIRPAVFDHNILAIDVAGLGQTFMKSCQLSRVILGGSSVDEPDHRHRLLRAHRDGPRGCRTCDNGDEVPSPHSRLSIREA